MVASLNYSKKFSLYESYSNLLGAAAALGSPPTNRQHLDGAKYWTMVQNTPMTKDGEIREFELFSGAGGRALRIGIYRPSGGTCQFKLVQQKEWASFAPGYQKVWR